MSSSVYVDCAARVNGNGTRSRPWNSIGAAGNARLGPGERLLLDRGTRCVGTLTISSSGTAGRPITVGAYGRGLLPLIVGTGPDAVLLQNASYVTVDDLRITNPGAANTERRGVHVVADDAVVHGVKLEDLVISHVDGNLTKDTGGSAGIQVEATGSTGRFAGLTIAGNTIDDVSRSGIFIVGTQDQERPAASSRWPAGSTGVVVSGNSLAHLAGDGIVSVGTVGAVLKANTVTDGNRAGTPYADPDSICDAGIWTFNANATVIEDNVVSHMRSRGCDGEGYDVDFDQDGTIVQDNVSEANAGGFILLCTDTGSHHAEVRYNLSIGDPFSFQISPCDIAGGVIGTLDGIRMYNNTFVAADPQVGLEMGRLDTSGFNPFAGDFEFTDNIVDATAGQRAVFPCGNDCSHNLFWRVPGAGSHQLVSNPLFLSPTVKGTSRLQVASGFRLLARSRAIGAGVAVKRGARSDFFGTRLPRRGRPTIGFYQPPTRKRHGRLG